MVAKRRDMHRPSLVAGRGNPIMPDNKYDIRATLPVDLTDQASSSQSPVAQMDDGTDQGEGIGTI